MAKTKPIIKILKPKKSIAIKVRNKKLPQVRVRLMFEPKPEFSIESDDAFKELLIKTYGTKVRYAGYISFDICKSFYGTPGPYYQALRTTTSMREIADLLKFIEDTDIPNYSVHVQLEHKGDHVLLTSDLRSVAPR